MSSGDKAKPPATFEERNPFDISRRSGTEVAAEIAKRMAALKQARARTSATPAATPSGRPKPSDSGAKPSGGEAKSPPIAAPVQPARMPKPTAPAPQPTATPVARDTGSAMPRVPFFASASATRRAIPPAPSLKQGSARLQASASGELELPADEPVVQPTAPVLEQESPRHEDSTAKLETSLAEATPIAASAIEESPVGASDAPAVATADVESPSDAETAEVKPANLDDDERRRAEARAIKARWIAARDLDELIDTSGAGGAPTVEAAIATAHEAGGAADDTSTHGLQAAAENPDGPLPDERPDDAASRDEWPRDESAEPERGAAREVAANVAEPEIAAATGVRTGMPDEATERLAPTVEAPVVRATPAAAMDRDDAQGASALDLAALDEIAGRREPTFDAPIMQAVPETTDEVREPGILAQAEVADWQRAQPAARAVTEPGTPAADEGLSIATLDEVAGRKEPTFDKPAQRAALEIEPPAPAVRDEANQVRETRIEAADATESRSDEPVATSGVTIGHPVVDDSPELSIAALDEAAGRKEPTFDEPVRSARPAAARTAAPRIPLRPIETRIEVRRIDTLRADPQLSARRPIFPHIEPEEWDVPPVVAARRERRGTSWAIGLGSVLLIAGITAPAAIWQQGRQVQDQVALVNPAPQQVQTPAPTATATAQAPAQGALPEAPQPEQPESPPVVTAQESSIPSTAANSETGQVAANPPPADSQPATTLGTMNDGGDVNDAPVVAPPPPMVNLASKTAPAETGAPAAARPFVPEQDNGPFLRAPTTGAASVPVAAAPGQSASVGVKPNLMVQLKPKATVSAAKPVAAKPRLAARKPKPFFQQSPDQMFETLIDTLSEGKPPNPATKPAAPSNRR